MARWLGVVSVTFLVGLVAGVAAHRAFRADESVPVVAPGPTMSTPAERRVVRPPEAVPAGEEHAADAPWVAEIVARLDRAASDRHRLDQEVTALHEGLRALEARVAGGDAERVPSAAPAAEDGTAHTKQDVAVDRAIPLETRLAALGMDQDRALEIAQRVNEVDLDRLYLRDQATREGWLNTPRYTQALQEVNSDLRFLREDVGDDAYDRYLYATGQGNRLVVGSVIGGSSAAEAGLKAGDTVLRYDDQRVFSTADLQAATVQGIADAPVTITVLRGDQRLRLYVPRGPLGIRMSVERRRPEPLP
jgi:hypothetical protein